MYIFINIFQYPFILVYNILFTFCLGFHSRSIYLTIEFSKWLYFFSFFKIFYLFIFREGGREGERGGVKHQCMVASRPLLGTWPATQACALIGNRTSDPLVCRPVLNPLSYTSQG